MNKKMFSKHYCLFFSELGDVNFLLIGDFNQVRLLLDRMPSSASRLGMTQFNDFITNANFIEIAL